MKHCTSCKHLLIFTGGEWHCKYRANPEREQQIATLYAKHSIQRKNAMPESTALKKNRQLNDGPLRYWT